MPGNWYVPGKPRPRASQDPEPDLNGPASYAEDRFTRAPMYIGRTDELETPGEGVTGSYPIERSYIPNLLGGKDQQSRQFLQHGTPQDKGAIYINPDPDPAKNTRLMRHEGIHSLLGQAGVDLPGIHSASSVRQFAEPLKRAAATNMGDPDFEVPPYAGAFREGDLAGITPQQRMDYLRAFGDELKRRNPKTAATFERMVLQPQMNYGRR